MFVKKNWWECKNYYEFFKDLAAEHGDRVGSAQEKEERSLSPRTILWTCDWKLGEEGVS